MHYMLFRKEKTSTHNFDSFKTEVTVQCHRPALRRAEAGKNLRPPCIAWGYSLKENKLIYLLK